MSTDAQIVILVALVSGLIGSAIGKSKWRPRDGFILWFILSFVWWILILVWPDYSSKEEQKVNGKYDITKRLKELSDLKDDWSITIREFQKLKKKILEESL